MSRYWRRLALAVTRDLQFHRRMVIPKLYVKTGCPWCEEVIDYLDEKGIGYTKIIVSGNREAMQEMIDLSGQSKAPTMDWAGEVLADFGVDELIPFLKSKHVL
jgi:glutaredoxin